MREQNRDNESEQNAANLVSEDGYSSTGEEATLEERQFLDDVPPAPDPNDPLDLAFSEWIYRRDTGSQDISDELPPQEDIDTLKIPQTIANEGIEFRSQRHKTDCVAAKPPSEPSGISTDDFSAVSSRKLLNFLSGRGRIWTRCEFFYSDIDKPW